MLPGEIAGVIVHRHVEQVKEHEARAAVNLQEPPEPAAVIAAKRWLADAGHQPEEEPDALDNEADLLADEARSVPPSSSS